MAHFIFFLMGIIFPSRSPEINFNEQSIYIFCSGSKTKSGLIAEQFNEIDQRATHIGIGFIEHNEVKIFNVTDIKANGRSALVAENLETFKQNAAYISIWECRADRKDLKKLKTICYRYLRQDVQFDYGFQLADDNKLYCSEFCEKILRLTNHEKYHYEPSLKPLNSLYKEILGRDILIYFPVDFFRKGERFKMIYEENLE